jgi:hypothetical protein
VTLAKDPQLGETIIWRGKPQVVETPPLFKAIGALWFLVSASATCFALVVAWALDASPAALLVFAAWSATIGLATLHGPRLWLEKVEYIITEGHVIWRRGPLRRVISRSSINYARIFWNRDDNNVGDIELVRAVPTGALRRRLLLRLRGLAAPDRVWSLIRGTDSQSEGANSARKAISQRLDEGERVLWSSTPVIGWRRFLPSGRRNWRTLALASLMFVVTVKVSLKLAGNLGVLIDAGLWEHPGALAALIIGETCATVLLLIVASYLIHHSLLLPAKQLTRTHYIITNRRILIQRENEELHLDRSQVVDVIDIPGFRGHNDVFFVLDGPRARAVELSGAFGESDRDTNLRPIFEALTDADTVARLLKGPVGRSPLPGNSVNALEHGAAA